MSDTMSDTALRLKATNAKIKSLEESEGYRSAKEADDSCSELTAIQKDTLERHSRWSTDAATMRSDIRAEKTALDYADLSEQIAAGQKRSRVDLPGSGVSSNWVRKDANAPDKSCKNQWKHNNECHSAFSEASAALKEAAAARDGSMLPRTVEIMLGSAQDALEKGMHITQQQNRVINLAYEHSWAAAENYVFSISSAGLGADDEDSKAIAEAIAKADKAKEKEKEKKSEVPKRTANTATPYGGGGRQFGGRGAWGSGAYYRNQQANSAAFGNGNAAGGGYTPNAAAVQCYRCGLMGHMARNCMQAPAPNGPGAPTGP